MGNCASSIHLLNLCRRVNEDQLFSLDSTGPYDAPEHRKPLPSHRHARPTWLAGAAGGAFGIKNPNDLYVGIMESRTHTDNIVARFKLKKAP